MNELYRARFHLLVPQEQVQCHTALIVGCGSIGRPTAHFLSRLGVGTVILVDPDVVSEENIGTQGWSIFSVGCNKVDVLKRELMEGGREEGDILVYPTKMEDVAYEVASARPTIVVLALDSLKARWGVWAALTRAILDAGETPDEMLMVDPRLAGEQLEVTALKWPSEAGDPPYGGWLMGLNDRDAVDAPCGARTLPETGSVAAAMVTRLVRGWVTNEVDLPHGVVMDIGHGGRMQTWRRSAT